MALWGKSDKTASRPTFIELKNDGTLAQDASGKKLVLIDNDEAALPENKAKGVQGAGWYLILKTGDRVRAELLIALADAPRIVEGNVADDSDATEATVGVGTDPA
jgi:hypothetical protein